MKLPKIFFGWSNIKWLIKEFIAMYSTKDSYFSKKRFESSIAFLGAMTIVLWHVYYSRATITNSEILADASLLFVIAGYTVKQIQSEKKETVYAPNPIANKKVVAIKPISKPETKTEDELPPIKDDEDLEA